CGPSSGRWRTVVCIASGPSLTADDVETVRRWRQEAQGEHAGAGQDASAGGPDREWAGGPVGVVVTNTTFRAAPWADVLYAMDRAWWLRYLDEVRKAFTG